MTGWPGAQLARLLEAGRGALQIAGLGAGDAEVDVGRGEVGRGLGHAGEQGDSLLGLPLLEHLHGAFEVGAHIAADAHLLGDGEAAGSRTEVCVGKSPPCCRREPAPPRPSIGKCISASRRIARLFRALGAFDGSQVCRGSGRRRRRGLRGVGFLNDPGFGRGRGSGRARPARSRRPVPARGRRWDRRPVRVAVDRGDQTAARLELRVAPRHQLGEAREALLDPGVVDPGSAAARDSSGGSRWPSPRRGRPPPRAPSRSPVARQQRDSTGARTQFSARLKSE